MFVAVCVVGLLGLLLAPFIHLFYSASVCHMLVAFAMCHVLVVLALLIVLFFLTLLSWCSRALCR